MKLPSTYVASDYEPELYKLWESSGLFVADPASSKQRFSISMPPPNETGTLHIGHALGIAIQDTLARHARLQGKDTLWLPGTDHAALPTNAIIERQLADEGLTKHDIGREAFLKRTMAFVGNSRDTINRQIRAMGASVDWTRARNTLDDSLTRCVNEVFCRLYDDGLIYRGNRIVNWDPKLETNVSDDEVEYIEEKGALYTLQYGPFEIATARPETKFGDKYVVMHPKDKRYAKYKHGETFEAEWINGPVKATVIKDEAVDPKFGTGVMTITPWHSQIDFEIAERHHLDREQIIDLKGKLLPIAGEFAGLPIEAARPKIVEKLAAKGLLLKTDENYRHNLAVNSRGKGQIEPQIRLQWFIDVNKPAVDWKGQKLSFKQVMQAVIRDGDIKLIPSRFDKVYFHWIDDLRDWCISRQIWWGHQIPVWYKTGKGKHETYVGVEPPKGDGWHRDADTLDTWFSSALWTWSTLIDPELASDYSLSLNQLLAQSPDFQAYHPNTVLDTAWDILFFWVARMILATTYSTGQIPFHEVYLHGLVLTETGGKMSKSNPETIIDPLEVIPEYGTDALRLALVQGVSAGNSQRLGRSKVVTNRNFCNKLWNVARFVEQSSSKATGTPAPQSLADHWILGQLSEAQKHISNQLDNYRFSDAYHHLYHFLWDDLADWYVEASKVDLNPALLSYVLRQLLIIAHPLAPFVTEAIWQLLAFDKKVMLAGQTYQKILAYDPKQAKQFEEIKGVVTELRSILEGLGEQVPVTYKASDLLNKNRTLIVKLSKLKDFKPTATAKGLSLPGTNHTIWLDISAAKAKHYLAKLDKKRAGVMDQIARYEGRLANKSYVEQAPEQVISETKEQLQAAKELLQSIDRERALFAKF